MEDVFQRIIEIEHEAQNLVAEGNARSEKIQTGAQDELRVMKTNIQEMYEHKIEQLKERNRKEADEKIARIREHTAQKLQQMNEVIAQNSNSWETQIFNRIIGR